MSPKKTLKYLLVFDLNGTLITRLNAKEFKIFKAASSISPDFTTNKMKVYKRPHWNQFLETVMNLPHISVGVWTSAQPKNAVALTEKLFGDYVNQLEFILDRSHCEDAPIGVKVDTAVKNLDLIFDSKLSKGKWDTNTILIDDSKSKAKKQPDNLVEIPTFDVTVNSQDDSLLILENWLRNLEPGDVRELIKQNHPFQ
ncbi:hypothetical protein HDV06_005527 [Boothiomyces sp. JEL0866]|nr:hypothetical protein HDV06_005527 [Boothiomyces sp. JEL0866]